MDDIDRKADERLGLLLEVQLPFDPSCLSVCQSVGRSFGRSVRG